MMDAQLELLREKWLGLSRRDQQAARLLGGALFIAIVLFGIILPIRGTSIDLQNDLDRAEDVFNELTALAPQALAVGGSGGELDPNALNSEVRRQAARYGVDIQRFEPDGDFLRVWLEDARYPSVVQWLGGLEALGITHSELTMDDRPSPGFVNVRITFGVDG